jgi:hypothetical protein
MGNFNSLEIFTKGTKINQLNKLCHQFNTDILAGYKTQADWRQATKEQQFRNVIGVGKDDRSIVAHNVNEQMQQNQHGGCAIMAMGHFSVEVAESGDDPSGLGCWCWFKEGSGNKQTRIVMAYQPSGSRSASSTGTTTQKQHERYFEAQGDLHLARTIFFEQLIAQLVVWKHTNLDIILLGNFNENVYSRCISKCFSQPDLMFSEQCLQCTGIYIPHTFKDGTTPIGAIFSMAGIECANAYILPHRGVSAITASDIGTKFPNIVCCSTRKLH